MVLMSHLVANCLATQAPYLAYRAGIFRADVTQGHWASVSVGLLLRLVSDGHLAVMIFFTLSGFALSINQLNSSGRNLPQAAAARYFRLMLPILAASLLAYAFMAAGLLHNLAAAEALGRPESWLTLSFRTDPSLLGALRFALWDVFFDYQAQASYNSSLWTMPIEMLGSIAIYGYLGVYRAAGRVYWRVLGLLTLALYGLQPELACFFVGLMLAEEVRGRTGGAAALRQVATPLRRFAPLTVFALAFAASVFLRGNNWLTSLLAVCIVLGVVHSNLLRGFFSNGLSMFLGRISFPLYLVHIVFVCSWSAYLLMALPRIGGSEALALAFNFVSTVMICVAAAVAFLPVESFSLTVSKHVARWLTGDVTPPV
ncbi:acyltransferase [Roseateles saccharophilus]|uniref:Peptidoglycan/LPS O-acetylase OafA/YrhL n=2 Tax=Roseateles saccharophilus TaxID=304 RepID=A0A4R3UQL1_ROSSA|nr:peptidoglycan/LPS O-acetylase OafA/YrhL [Roseateles saccharophilus]